MAILTDGQEWSFFLPGEQGAYHERCVYKLDMIVRDIDECCRIFERYLKRSAVISGAAIINAKDDYKNVSKQRQIEEALPKAWSHLLKEQDEILVELVADKVETLCGFKPGPDVVRSYLDSLLPPQPTTSKEPHHSVDPERSVLQRGATRGLEDSDNFFGFTLHGKSYNEGSAIDTLFRVFEIFSQRDPKFLERYAGLPKTVGSADTWRETRWNCIRDGKTFVKSIPSRDLADGGLALTIAAQPFAMPSSLLVWCQDYDSVTI